MKLIAALVFILTITPICADFNCAVDGTEDPDSGLCYQISEDGVSSWQAARDFCLTQGGDLVDVKEESQNTFILEAIDTFQSPDNNKGYWIGQNSIDGSGTWSYLSDSSASVFLDNLGTSSMNCIIIARSGNHFTWKFKDCDTDDNRPLCVYGQDSVSDISTSMYSTTDTPSESTTNVRTTGGISHVTTDEPYAIASPTATTARPTIQSITSTIQPVTTDIFLKVNIIATGTVSNDSISLARNMITELSEKNATAQDITNVVEIVAQTTSQNTGNGRRAAMTLLADINALIGDSFRGTDMEINTLAQTYTEVAVGLLPLEPTDEEEMESEDNSQLTSLADITELMENFTMRIANSVEVDTDITTDNVDIGIRKQLRSTFNGLEYASVSTGEDEQLSNNVHVTFPSSTAETINTDDDLTFTFVTYKHPPSVTFAGMTLNSPLISASIIQNHVSELEQNIEFVFRRGNKKKTEPSCVYLNTFTNVWSSKGMVLIDYNATHVRCGASHLTSFAVLMQVTGVEMIEVHATALSFITYTGCGISIVALILTLGIFMYVRHSTGERTMIHRNLSLALLIAQSLFVGGISATFNKWFCMFVAMALHYFFLAVFSMMLVEGIHLYRQVVQVFERGSFRLKYLIILGWLLPLVIVGITAGYNSHGYGNDYMCWLDTDSGMVWAFVGPTLAIIALNLIVMVLVVRIIILSSAMSNKNNIEQAKAGVKGLILLLPLLGGTWLFGVFFVSNELIAFQYIFAILNSLQGLFIFLFHCVGNGEVRGAFKRRRDQASINSKVWEMSSTVETNADKKSGGFSSRKHNTVEDKDKLYPDIPSRPSTSESIMSTRTTSGITYTIPGEVNEYDANEVEDVIFL